MGLHRVARDGDRVRIVVHIVADLTLLLGWSGRYRPENGTQSQANYPDCHCLKPLGARTNRRKNLFHNVSLLESRYLALMVFSQ